MNINLLVPYENNPRFNDEAVEYVANSIKEFGFKVPIIIDKNNVIIAGHTRLKAAQKLGLTDVPVIKADDLTEDQVKAFRLADNKTGEIATWNFEKLEDELKNIELDMTMFNFEELENELNPEEDDFNVDETIEEIKEPVTKLGDVWQLGNHRLICGDSTSKETLDKLMQGNKAHLLVTDPPYNINVSNSQGMTIQNDNMKDEQFYNLLCNSFKTANENLKKGGTFYIWHADTESLNFRKASESVGWKVRQCLIWVKNGFTLGRQDYQWKHEPCLYGWKDGAAHYFLDDRTQETVIEDKPNINKMSKDKLKEYCKDLLKEREATTIIREDKPLKNIDHPTMKPIKLISRLIINSSKKNEIVLDVFGGSGSTLIAAEQLNRICYMVELDPVYCDVIIKRWEILTGNKAIKQ